VGILKTIFWLNLLGGSKELPTTPGFGKSLLWTIGIVLILLWLTVR
jgi:hypothetical protein